MGGAGCQRIWNRSCSDAPRCRRPRQSSNWSQWARPRRNRFSAFWKISAGGSPRQTPNRTTSSYPFLPEVEAEAEQRRRDRRHWKAKLERLTTDIEQEPERVRRSYPSRPTGWRTHRPCLSLAGSQLTWWRSTPMPNGSATSNRWPGLAATVLARHGLNPAEQTRADSEAVRALLVGRRGRSALPDPWAFFAQILGWRASQVAGAPGGPALPADLSVRVEESDTDLAPHWAVTDPDTGLADPRPDRGPRREPRKARCARRLGGDAAPAAGASAARNRRADRPPADRRRIASHSGAARGDQWLAEVSAPLARRGWRPADARWPQADPFLLPAAQ